MNPDLYTAWNYRKLAVEHYLKESPSDIESIKAILDEELRVVSFHLAALNLKLFFSILDEAFAFSESVWTAISFIRLVTQHYCS